MDTQIKGLADRIGEKLSEKGLRLVTAESLTAGLISAAVTETAGSSSWFERGFVTYTNEAKKEMLGVSESTLARYSAVSGECVSQMLRGALERSSAHFAIAVSGIAGPGGELPGKPVGTVFVGVARKGEAAEVRRCQFEGNRESVRRKTVVCALEMLLETI